MSEQKINNELPLVAIIGPTNAGKSTLFNRLTGSWQAVTAKEESTTRDRVFGEVDWQNKRFAIVDTAGLVEDESNLYKVIHEQTVVAIEEADLILFVYDATDLEPAHKEYLNTLRGRDNIWLVANKVDNFDREKKVERLDHLGWPYFEVSAATGRGTGDLLEAIVNYLPVEQTKKEDLPVIALVGRPNVGKSTLLNALTKSQRAVVSPVSGTTRDIVTAKLNLNGQAYLLADTAGVRRRGQIEVGIEKFSVKRTLTAIAQASAVIVLVDATEGLTRGDLHLIYFAKEEQKPILVLFNKTDLLNEKSDISPRRLTKFDQIAISAANKTNLTQVTDWITENVTAKAENSNS
ncbi:MAG TPA: ribosome biogenesis GTPase Der [Candidatus Saccharimonadales bacterium]|nr:ribosome biogenesis GTPase Der [Candidatus Saccharimonadales bacterium]